MQGYPLNLNLQLYSRIIETLLLGPNCESTTGNCSKDVTIIQEAIYRANQDSAPEWNEPIGVNIEIQGIPNMKMSFSHDWNDDPLISTAMHGVNAIPYVCDADPGFVSFLDLPLVSLKI